MVSLNSQRVMTLAMENPINQLLLERLATLDLPNCMLTAGCLFQAVWNKHCGQPAGWGVKDYDVIYYDDDLSWEAEDRVIQYVRRVCSSLKANIEVRNQARVHLWYESRFGVIYPALQTVTDGIDRYLIKATCVGINISTGDLYCTHGLDDLDRGILRINPLNPQPDLFLQKANSYQEHWPYLAIEP